MIIFRQQSSEPKKLLKLTTSSTGQRIKPNLTDCNVLTWEQTLTFIVKSLFENL